MCIIWIFHRESFQLYISSRYILSTLSWVHFYVSTNFTIPIRCDGEYFKVENALSLAEGVTFKTKLRSIYDIPKFYSLDDGGCVWTYNSNGIGWTNKQELQCISIIRPFRWHFCLGFIYLIFLCANTRQMLILDKIKWNIIKV